MQYPIAIFGIRLNI